MPEYSDVRRLAWPTERDACGVGFIAAMEGGPRRSVLDHALAALRNLAHRGAVSADGRTGDGAGVQTQIPYALFRRDLRERGIEFGPDEELGVGSFFVANDGEVEEVYGRIAAVLDEGGLEVLAWRDPPIDDGALGEEARARRPIMRQVLLRRPAGIDVLGFERLLYLTRKRIERRLRAAGLGRAYVPSMSSRTIVYKGLMVGDALATFYRDLADPDYATAIALFHERYSTNTLPRWSLAQPFRFLGHNGEINTLQGNVNFMRSREPVLRSAVFGDAIAELLPIIEPGGSDSAALDNAFELLALAGRDPLHALAMLVPEAFENDDAMDPDLRGFYEHHATLMEPWDGPAALALSDGRYAVAALDRNGLRPARYVITDDGLVVVGSEAGMVPLPDRRVVERGRLGPGQMLAVDVVAGELLRNVDVKRRLATQAPYRSWVDAHVVRAPAPSPRASTASDTSSAVDGAAPEALARTQKLFGYSAEDLDRVLEPMVSGGEPPVGSMGDDTPLAVLSEQPQALYRYFKQRFAQVTNPPIDPLRERRVMSLRTVLGPRGPLLDEAPTAASVLRFERPVIDEAEYAWLLAQTTFRPKVLAARWPVADGPEGLAPALEELCDAAVEAVEAGHGVLVLSDRDADAAHAPIPMLLAVSAVHQRLLRAGRRTRTALVADTGEAREDHHVACLIGFGAALVHPFLALASARDVAATAKGGPLCAPEEATERYLQALDKGLLKVMSKMGISALSSYRGAQIFEALGVDQDVIDRYFTGTTSRLGGAGVDAFATDVLRFHGEAFGEDPVLRDRGIYRFRKAGEYHALNPLVFKALHKAVRTGDDEAYAEYARQVDERPPTALRDLLEPRPLGPEVPLDEVEDVAAIVRRFSTQAMSHGSVSREVHETLAVAMNRIGGKSNSGEGGEDEHRFAPYREDQPQFGHGGWYPKAGDWGNSAIKQVASGRFGVTAAYLVSAQELEIKMAQGSKPGEGGQIPGPKVNDEIARIRRSVPGVTLISPPPHHDIYSIEDLSQLIYDLKRVHPSARVGVKLVATAGVGTIAAGVAKGYADNVQLSGADGGTGASPLSSIKNVGVPWELGLAEAQQVLVANGLRERVTLRVDGGMKTGRDVVVAALLGAEAYGFGTAALVAAGCAMIRQCHLNTCPVGVATQRPDLRAKYPGEPEHVVRFMTYVAQQVRMLLARLGARSLDEVIGRVDLLTPRPVALPRRARLDLSSLLRDPDPTGTLPRKGASGASGQVRNERPGDDPLDEQLLRDARPALDGGERVARGYAVGNRDRSLGARLAGAIARRHGDAGLPPGSVDYRFRGAAGQSFGAFAVAGMRLTLVGEAQDYVGKGMSGGELVVRPPEGDELATDRSVILGNTALYGATGGGLFAAGQAGERLAVRNSGAVAVVEGCGDHGAEYMTGGAVVVLGRVGRNFGAGMSGGVAYLWDDGTVAERVNLGMVSLAALGAADAELLRALIERHAEATGSRVARAWLDAGADAGRFLRVAPSVAEEGQLDPAPLGVALAAARLSALGGTAA
jgi:glutamate synthase domain-containing protein 2/glutamate synthase domain-containing protein 1/glutamate synthase domain-containing protein 3